MPKSFFDEAGFFNKSKKYKKPAVAETAAKPDLPLLTAGNAVLEPETADSIKEIDANSPQVHKTTMQHEITENIDSEKVLQCINQLKSSIKAAKEIQKKSPAKTRKKRMKQKTVGIVLRIPSTQISQHQTAADTTIEDWILEDQDFSMIFAQAAFAMGLNADIDKIVLTYNGLPVFASSTPYSVGFEGGFKDGLLELTAHLKKNWLKDPEAAVEEEAAAFNAPIMQESTEDIGISSCQQITIKLRNSKNKICEISVQLDAPIADLLESVQAASETTPVKLVFDGEILTLPTHGTLTLRQLSVEDGDVFDAHNFNKKMPS